MKRNVDIVLEYQPPIDLIPPNYGDIYKQACSGDKVTVETWRKTWVDHYRSAKDRFGNFAEKSYGQLFGINRHKPAIVIGSGPSLKYSLEALKTISERQNPLLMVSCLHNFGLFEDQGFHADYYLSLDSGGVVIDDVSESRNKDGGFYWEKTKGKKLLAYVASDPRLFDLWQGEIYLFNCLLPDMALREEIGKIERFSHYISSGGNALGACMYTAKAVMGSSEIIYVGADFCFDYDHKFHAYQTHYDNVDGKGIGTVIRWPDVFGNARATWPSYLNFKFWTDWVAMNVPGNWASASEGLLGAYPEGNLRRIKMAPLNLLTEHYRIAEEVDLGEFKYESGVQIPIMENGVHKKKSMKVEELFKDSKQPLDITLF